MAGTKSALRTARIAVIAFAVLLATGVIGSWILSSKTLASSHAQVMTDASTLVDDSIANIVTGSDLAAPVSSSRANQIDESLQSSGFASTGFDSVTIWRTDGQVVYSSVQKLLAARLPTEASHLRAVSRNGASSEIKDGVFEVFVPFNANGADAVIELDRLDGPIAATATPLRIASGMLALLFLATLYVLFRLSHAIASAAANQAFRPTQTAGLGHVSQAPETETVGRVRKGEQAAYAQPGYREEAEARRRAEERAKALEDQVSLLQEQYRNALTELRNSQRKLQDSLTSGGTRGDARLEERLLKAEGQARLLEGQLGAMSAERDKLATQVTEAREDATRAAAPSPEVERKLQQLQQESIALRAELEGTKTELDVAKRELGTNQTRAKNLEAELAKLGDVATDAERQRTELKELRQIAAEADQMRGELEGLRGGAEEAVVLRGQLEQLLPQMEAARGLRGELDEVIAAREESERSLATVREELEATTAALETLRGETEAVKGDLAASAAELDAARGQLDAIGRELVAAREDADSVRAELQAARETIDSEGVHAEETAAAHAQAIAAKDEELIERLEAGRAELQAELDQIEAGLREKLTATTAELAAETEQTRAALEASQTRSAEAEATLEEVRLRFEETQQRLAETGAELEATDATSRMHLEELARVQADAQTFQQQLEVSRTDAEARTQELQQIREQLRSTLDELQALGAAKSGDENDLARAQAETQATRRELDAAMAQLETTSQQLDATSQEIASAHEEAERARSEFDAAQRELELVRTQMGGAQDEATGWQTRFAELEGALQEARAELETVRAELADAHAEIQTELSRSVEIAGRAEQAEQELSMLRGQQMEASTDPGHDELEEIARLAQERLASQTDKLTETEDRAHDAERQLQEALGRLGELEDALRKAADGEDAAIQNARASDIDAALEDRRASTPFMKELSLDAKKTLTQILGITLSLKHKKTAQDQAPFLRQLSAMAKRLDRTVSDLAEADKLVHGEIELNVRRTNLEALVERVVEESGVGGDHDVRVETEELVVGVDPIRMEQILNGLLRNSADRTSPGSEITVRLKHEDDGALLSVEDKEASSDGSLSPVVSKLADVMGGWAKVESRPSGGSAFRVYLPDQSGGGVTTPKSTDGEDTLQITVENPPAATEGPDEPVDFSEAGDDDPWAAGQLLVQELQRLSHQEGK
jgi:DNA repair exonuclease SbcCD ATPase subunit